MKNNFNLRDYFSIGRDVLRSCWNWHGPYFNRVPWFHGESARRLVRNRYGNGVPPGAHLSRCLLVNRWCVNPSHTFSSINDLEHLYKYIGSARADGCRLWTGCTRDGYPLITIDGVTRRAARVLWELRRGPIPSGLFVCHTCDERRCMAIGEIGGDGHLWIGSAQENVDDMIAKQRGHWQKKPQRKGLAFDGWVLFSHFMLHHFKLKGQG